ACMRHLILHGRNARATFNIDNQQILLKLLGLRQNPPVRTENHAVSVEDQLIVPADLINIDQRLVELPNLRGEQLGAEIMLSNNNGGRAAVNHHLGAGLMEIGNGVVVIEAARVQALVVPEILADRQAHKDVADPDELVSLV